MPNCMLNNYNPLYTRGVESSNKGRKENDWWDVSYTCMNFTQVHFTLDFTILL